MKKTLESYRQEKPQKKSKQSISSTIEQIQKPKKSISMNNNINLSDIPEIDLKQFGNPLIGKFYRPKKQLISIRLDADVLHWFKTYPQYQKLINQVCRLYMLQKNRVQLNSR